MTEGTWQACLHMDHTLSSNWSLPTAPQAGCGCVALTRIRPTTTTQIPFLHLYNGVAERSVWRQGGQGRGED